MNDSKDVHETGKFDGIDLYAALIHELKNNLGLLAITLDSIPLGRSASAESAAAHDATVDAARLLCQGVMDRLQQALLIYKANNRQLHPLIDAYSPHDLVNELRDRADSLARGRFRIEVALSPDLPAIWFFDRDLVEMALINAIQNSLAYARSVIRIEAGLIDDCLALSVRDDSDGYPEHILSSVATHTPYRSTGTGLGLQFSRLIVQTHLNQGRTGELRLYNDAGAVFCLLLP
jgi:signal transduction histidine kinase